MTSVGVKTVNLNQCVMIWNKITLVSVMLLAIKKEKRVDSLGGWKEDHTFLKILGPI